MSDEFPIVVVVWTDCVLIGDSLTFSEARDSRPSEVRDVGFLMHEDDDCIVLAATWSVDLEKVRSVATIPRGMVRDVVRMGQPHYAKKGKR